MKLLNKLFIVGIFALGFSVTTANAQLNDILNRMDSYRLSMQNMRADIKETKVEAIAPKSPQVRNGKFIYQPVRKNGKDVSAFFRLDWASPIVEIVSVANGKYIVYTPSTSTAYRGKADSKELDKKGGGVMKLLTSGSKQELKDKYTFKFIDYENVGTSKAAHLRLTPKGPEKFSFADWWVDSDGRPIQVAVSFANGDVQTFLMSGFKENTPIAKNEWVPEIPKSVKVQDV